MSHETLNAFPANYAEALTMLYLQNQDLSKLSPADLADKYAETLKKIRVHCANNKRSFFD